jgi:hypothetical protein
MRLIVIQLDTNSQLRSGSLKEVPEVLASRVNVTGRFVVTGAIASQLLFFCFFVLDVYHASGDRIHVDLGDVL